ncbi:hypothetical protein NA57DRAFT_51711 [Rhizodiscina lignyota]|uniref:DUF7730 domain-containing protein n=1 Tax=Rhizodiscina lignyota TaxID=1504668 RepID=A0A9P4MGY9_9PEZI|nr:hypothetical protein NA57DRAFT_51711 [Rhizodiscina lignyota]
MPNTEELPILSYDELYYEPQPQSRLLSLPTEIRLEIYYHLLILPSDLPPSLRTLAGRNHLSSYLYKLSSSSSDHPNPADALIHPQILATCRQCCEEAIPILYKCNTFTAHPSLLTSLPSLPPLQKSITSSRVLCMIRRWHVQVRLDCDPRYSRDQVTQAFSAAEELEVECWQAMYGGADPLAVLGKFAGVRGVRRVTVKGSMGADWIKRMEQSMRKPVKEVGNANVEEGDWGVVEREVVGGGRCYELWTNGGR